MRWRVLYGTIDKPLSAFGDTHDDTFLSVQLSVKDKLTVTIHIVSTKIACFLLFKGKGGTKAKEDGEEDFQSEKPAEKSRGGRRKQEKGICCFETKTRFAVIGQDLDDEVQMQMPC